MPVTAVQAATAPAAPAPGQTAAPATIAPAQPALPADSVKLSKGTPAPIKAVGTAAKVGGQVVTGAAGATTGLVVGAGFSAIAAPIAGAAFLSEKYTGLPAVGLALVGFLGGVILSPVAAVVGAAQFGYIGARSGADLVDKAVDPKHVDLGTRMDEHFSDVDTVSGKIMDKIFD